MISDCEIKLHDVQLIMNLEGIGRRGSWCNSNYCPGICLQGRRKITDNCRENSRYSGRKSNSANVEYKASLKCVLPCIMYELTRGTNLMQQLWYIIKNYLYMFREFTCPSSRVQVVCYCIWVSALGFVAVVPRIRCVVLWTVCRFVSRIQTHTQCTRPRTGS